MLSTLLFKERRFAGVIAAIAALQTLTDTIIDSSIGQTDEKLILLKLAADRVNSTVRTAYDERKALQAQLVEFSGTDLAAAHLLIGRITEAMETLLRYAHIYAKTVAEINVDEVSQRLASSNELKQTQFLACFLDPALPKPVVSNVPIMQRD